MSVQAGMSDSLWEWLQDHGWRESIFRPDRRKYRQVPRGWVTRLIDADAAGDERERILVSAVKRAAYGGSGTTSPADSQPARARP